MSVELGISPEAPVLSSLINITRYIFMHETPAIVMGRWDSCFSWNTNELPEGIFTEPMKAIIMLVPVERGRVVPLHDREIRGAELLLKGADGTGVGFSVQDDPEIYENDFDRYTLEHLVEVYGSHDHDQCVELQKPKEEPKPTDPVAAEDMVVIDKRHSSPEFVD